MTITELSNKIAGSSLSDATKAKAAALLAGKTDLSIELLGKVKDLVRDEIDADFTSLGIDVSNDAEVKNAEAEFDSGSQKIQAELAEDIAFVEKELLDIDAQREKLEKAVDGE